MSQLSPGLLAHLVLRGSLVTTVLPVRKVPSGLRVLRARKGLPAWWVRVVRPALPVRQGHKDPPALRGRPGMRKRKPSPEGSRVQRDQSAPKGRQARLGHRDLRAWRAIRDLRALKGRQGREANLDRLGSRAQSDRLAP
ncbi:hypothetical protein AB4097_16145 [Microvirga sp. 2MCAF35]|uniref:hypothetical protein n=1 Tax=Microvirga sp. 2MCAF35 TaxID=3232987 RepID=UPI003F9B2105